MTVNTKQAIWMWGELTPIERMTCNACVLKSDVQVELKDAGCTLRVNTCLAADDFPMKKHLEELILKYEVDNP